MIGLGLGVDWAQSVLVVLEAIDTEAGQRVADLTEVLGRLLERFNQTLLANLSSSKLLLQF